MAIGDIQNRFDVGGQFNQASRLPNQNEQQSGPAQPQQVNTENQAPTAATPQPQVQNTTPQGGTQQINNSQNLQDSVELTNRTQQVQSVQTPPVGQNNGRKCSSRFDTRNR